MLIESRGLSSVSTCVLKAELGKLDIKRHALIILCIRLQVNSFSKLEILKYLSTFVLIHNVIDDVIQKMQRHDDLIQIHAVYQVNAKQCS